MNACPRTRTYFISDIHLGARYIKDARAHENRICAFLRQISSDAKTLYLLGDILDYWFEYRTVVPRGYIRFFGALAQLADAGVKIVWFTGNHDIWLFDYLRDEIGIEIVDAPDGGVFAYIDKTEFFLGHGDGMGKQKPGFRFIRSLFRNKLCQKLFAAIHPRWTVGFAHAWSSRSRKVQESPTTLMPSTRPSLEAFVSRLCTEHPRLRYVVLGHHHCALDEPVNDHCRMIVLGNWIDRSTYAVFDGRTLRLKEFKPGEQLCDESL